MWLFTSVSIFHPFSLQKKPTAKGNQHENEILGKWTFKFTKRQGISTQIGGVRTVCLLGLILIWGY